MIAGDRLGDVLQQHRLARARGRDESGRLAQPLVLKGVGPLWPSSGLPRDTVADVSEAQVLLPRCRLS
jgi:hypothetical protein